jgi:hypothetical protein
LSSNPIRSSFLCVMVAFAAMPVARACGYHDPSAVNVGMLNLAYPDALYVRTAVWVAQRDGVIGGHPPSLAEQAVADGGAQRSLRLLDTVSSLGLLRDRLGVAREAGPLPSFSIVLMRPMLWSRFVPAGSALSLQPHVQGPLPSDVVVVTDEPVVDALVDGRIGPGDAIARGLLRFYGPPADVAEVSSLIGRLPQARASAASAGPDAMSRVP